MIRTYRDIRYTLKRSKRKTASIYVERDGQITLIAPEELSIQQIEKVLEEKRRWIYKNLAEWHDLNATSHRTAVRERRRVPVSWSVVSAEARADARGAVAAQGWLLLPAGRPATAAKAVAAFKDFYRDKGPVRINERVAFFKTRWMSSRSQSRFWISRIGGRRGRRAAISTSIGSA